MSPNRLLKFYSARELDDIPQLQSLSADDRFAAKVVTKVLPFRTNNYVINELINWDNIPEDPMYQLTFPQRDMLESDHFYRIAGAIKRNETKDEISRIANEIRLELNPHPAEQLTANVPIEDDEVIPGVQHKYRETALVFPSSGQTCHAYCTFCFRWAQFVGMTDLKFATDESNRFQKYLRDHKEITDVLFTGGDPMIMTAKKLRIYIEPLLAPEFEHIKNIRIGTKSLSFWPYKYVTEKDSDEIIRLFEQIVSSGKHLSIMAHFNHWVELSTPIVREAVRRIRGTGAVIRTQSPLVKHINDDPKVWEKMWKMQTALGMIPYYMFVARNTGAQNYFGVTLGKAVEIYQNAIQNVSGLSRTVRGPSMSATPGKVVIEGVTKLYGERAYVMNFLQARNPDWVKRPFFAHYDKHALWLDELVPAFDDDQFFYENELSEMLINKEYQWKNTEDQNF